MEFNNDHCISIGKSLQKYVSIVNTFKSMSNLCLCDSAHSSNQHQDMVHVFVSVNVRYEVIVKSKLEENTNVSVLFLHAENLGPRTYGNSSLKSNVKLKSRSKLFTSKVQNCTLSKLNQDQCTYNLNVFTKDNQNLLREGSISSSILNKEKVLVL